MVNLATNLSPMTVSSIPMPYFNRFDIIEAHYRFCVHFHNGMWSKEYKRLCRIMRYYRPSLSGALSENGEEIYNSLREKFYARYR